MGQSTAMKFGEKELSALNTRADWLSQRDANDWEEAIDWGAPDCSNLCASDRRMVTSPDFE